jgi:hypothetical protein
MADPMFRLTLHDTDNALVMKLEGCLAGPSVHETYRCWQRVIATLRGRVVEVDMRDVCHVDEEGRKLMTLMHLEGVRFRTAGCLMPEIVREVAEAAEAGYSFVWRN